MIAVNRPDVDVVEDIHNLIVNYPPAAHDRHHVQVSVQAGIVTLSGYVTTPITRSYLLQHIKEVEGVRDIHHENFYDDESIRLSIGRIVPTGVQVVVVYGGVILAGKLPQGVSEGQLETKVSAVPGVHKVVLAFN
jgi:osmotically-inducible protein OsmY